jgi:DNA-directed RNA polymerase specialized sigma24 family protein
MDRETEFRRLYDAHRATLHAYFTGRTGDPQSATDLMQDVFLRAWQHLEKLTRYRLSLARRAVAEALDRYDKPTEQ